jgi:hypothetical protein
VLKVVPPMVSLKFVAARSTVATAIPADENT